MLIPDQTLKDLYQKMADLSKKQCEVDCFKIRGTIGGCCSDMYCEFSIQYAKDNNITLTPTGNTKLPLMGENGCIAPPWLRPMCTLHICDKSLLKEEFNKAYFSLREKIDLQEDKLFIEQNKKETIQ